jgi:hypothetical protein
MFQSCFTPLDKIPLPAFGDDRIMMMPLTIGDMSSVPASMDRWKDTLQAMFDVRPQHAGKTGYITIDEKRVVPGASHRRGGLHVDGIYHGSAGAWGGGPDSPNGPGGSWGSAGNGMLTVSSHAMCRAWNGVFEGWPGDEGECDHLESKIATDAGTLFEPGRLYWVDGLCVHESIPAETTVDRQFVRLSLPNTGPWFEGYTVNPLGVLPTGPILGPREFMLG